MVVQEGMWQRLTASGEHAEQGYIAWSVVLAAGRQDGVSSGCLLKEAVFDIRGDRRCLLSGHARPRVRLLVPVPMTARTYIRRPRRPRGARRARWFLYPAVDGVGSRVGS